MAGVARVAKTNVSSGTSVTVSEGFNSILILLVHYVTTLSGRRTNSVSWNSQNFTELYQYHSSITNSNYFNMGVFYLLNPTPATANLVATYMMPSVLIQFDNVDQSSPFIDYDDTGGKSGSSSATDDMTADYGAYGVGIGLNNTETIGTLTCDNTGLAIERSGSDASNPHGYSKGSCVASNSTIKFTMTEAGQYCFVTGAVLRYKEQILAAPIWY